MSNKIIKPLTLAIGAAFLGSVALSQTSHASTAFQVKPLVSGYTLAGAEGKCSEGKCAVSGMDTNKDHKVSMEEAKSTVGPKHSSKPPTPTTMAASTRKSWRAHKMSGGGRILFGTRKAQKVHARPRRRPRKVRARLPRNTRVQKVRALLRQQGHGRLLRSDVR